MKLTDIFDYKNINKYKADQSFIAYEQCDDTNNSFYDSLKEIKEKNIIVLVGAEGGFNEEVVKYTRNNSFKVIA